MSRLLITFGDATSGHRCRARFPKRAGRYRGRTAEQHRQNHAHAAGRIPGCRQAARAVQQGFTTSEDRPQGPGADVSTQAPFPDVFFGPFHPPPPASACWLRPHARLRPWSGRASVGAFEDQNSRSGACGARANAASLNGRTSRSICSPGRSFHWFFRVTRASVESPAGEPPAAVLRYARQRQRPGVEEN